MAAAFEPNPLVELILYRRAVRQAFAAVRESQMTFASTSRSFLREDTLCTALAAEEARVEGLISERLA